jgi:hypothetical protein
VTGIERTNNRTEVVVDEGINTVHYALDEALIYFGAALEEQDFQRAAQVRIAREAFTEQYTDCEGYLMGLLLVAMYSCVCGPYAFGKEQAYCRGGEAP